VFAFYGFMPLSPIRRRRD